MPRVKIIPDADVFTAIRQLLAEGGDKAVSFAAVGRKTGLAAPTLVQRFGSRDAMVQLALMAAWDGLEKATAKAEADAPMNAKGALALLKAVAGDAPDLVDHALLAVDFRDPALRGRATDWRTRMESALAVRLGGGDKARETAALLFAAWQGQMLWQMAGGKAFRLKDAVRRLV